MIKGLQAEFPEYLIGYSDHTLPNDNMSALITAWLVGAVVIEKHFTHDKSLICSSIKFAAYSNVLSSKLNLAPAASYNWGSVALPPRLKAAL